MTIRQEFICDKKGCPSKESSWAECLSKGWLDIHAGDTSYQLCSVACLRDWLADVQPVDTEAESLGVVFTCDECEKEILMRPGDEWPTWLEIRREEQGATRHGFCSNSCLVLWAGHYADAHFTDTLSKKFLAEHAVKP